MQVALLRLSQLLILAMPDATMSTQSYEEQLSNSLSEALASLQIKDRPDAVELVDSKAGYGIQLENVRFGYRPELPILQVNCFTSARKRLWLPAAITEECSPVFGMLICHKESLVH